MQEFEQLHVDSRTELRAWLAANHTRQTSVWLVTYKKHMPDKYVSWDDIVAEVLCFGWIDSLPRKLDANRSQLLISPRRKGSPWSRRNKEMVAQLAADGLMTPAGWAVIERARRDGSWTVYDDVEDLVIPSDLQAALADNASATRHFAAFADSAKKGILWWIKSARGADTRRKRIAETVWLAAHNIRANFPEARAFKQHHGGESDAKGSGKG